MIIAATRCYEQDPDVRLMLRVQAGSREAFDELVNRYSPELTLRFRRSPPLRNIAEDLSQEVLMRVYRARHRYVPGATLRTWISRIAVNVARNAARRLSRHPDETHVAGGSTRLRKAARDIAEPYVLQPLEVLVRDEQRETALTLLRRLSARQQLAMRLVSLEKMPIRAAARRMSISPGALKSLLARARASCRSEFRRMCQVQTADTA